MRPKNIIEHPRRRTDVADVDGAGEWFCGGLHEADLHGSERAGVVGADGVSGGLAGVAVEAAGDIDGELICWMRVHPIDGGVEWRTRVAGGAGAEQCIDEPSGVLGMLIEIVAAIVVGRGRGRPGSVGW